MIVLLANTAVAELALIILITLKTIMLRIIATALVRPARTVLAAMPPPARLARTTAIGAPMIIVMPGGHAAIR